MKNDSEETAATVDQPDPEAAMDEEWDELDGDEDGGEDEDVERVARVRSALEAVFFAADDPLSRNQIAKVLPDVPEGLLDRALRQLELDFAGPMRGIHLSLVAGGWQFRTNPDLQAPVLRLFEARPTRLSKAALETLAIVAYRQPVTRAIVEEIRGVDCGGVLRTLQDYGLVTVVGKMDDLGRPNLYGTTDRFLEFFGLAALDALPTLENFEVDSLELLGEDLQQLAEEMELEALDSDDSGDAIDRRSESYHADDSESLESDQSGLDEADATPDANNDNSPDDAGSIEAPRHVPETPEADDEETKAMADEEPAPFPTVPSDRMNEDDGDTQ